jgi:beta-lactamase superfamily II metal-dependent hydrolase
MSQIPTVLYAQVEQIIAVQDYPPNEQCLRFVAVDDASFLAAAYNSDLGCSTYLIDVSWSEFVRTPVMGSALLPRGWAWSKTPDLRFNDWPNDLWIRVQFQVSSATTGVYAYELFADAEPTYVRLQSMTVASGAPVMAPTSSSKIQSVRAHQSFGLYGYHVGQGMCAMLKGQSEGFLFDVGAGTPVIRSSYRSGVHANGTAFVNELKTATTGLQLQAVISHPDSDHWRILDWDASLCASVTAIFTPAGTPALAFTSTHVKPKVYALGNTVANDATGATLFKTHRSRPAHPDRNGECLVVETHANGTGLLPGDYVYDRMATDANPAINALAASSWAAVMVPHHGDAASASVSVSPAVPGSTPAFFSAGTHAAYRHPTAASLSAHKSKAFDNIDNHTCDDIIERPLP